MQVPERLDRLTTNVVVPQLSHVDAPFRIEVVRWETAAAQRVTSEHNEFVDESRPSAGRIAAPPLPKRLSDHYRTPSPPKSPAESQSSPESSTASPVFCRRPTIRLRARTELSK